MSLNGLNRTFSLLAVFGLGWSMALPARAHCDGLDGPVVNAGRQALAAGDVNLALIWIQPADETELRQAFTQTLAVRKLNPEAKELADRYFFETLVRLHRAGEGAPYTGLKPAGRDLGHAIPAADKAVATGSATSLTKMLTDASAVRLRQRFEKVLAAKKYDAGDLRAGREYVKAYVEFVHYVEGLHNALLGAGAAAHEHE